MRPNTDKATHLFTLDNGLRVVIRQDPGIPMVCASLFHKVGTRHERPDQQGLAYLTGGAAFKNKALINEIGAIANGWLDYDVSTYSLEAPRAALSSVLQMLASRMEEPILSQERLNAGIKRTKELERADPYFTSDFWITSQFEQLIFPAAGKAHTFGDIADLDHITVEDVLHWHKENYAPNNTILVIAGDTTLEHTQPVVQRLFGGFARGTPYKRQEQPVGEPHTAERRLTQYLDTELPRLQMAFNTPSVSTTENIQDIRALQVISALLTSGPDAWLPGTLSEGKKTLTSAITRLPGYRLNDDLFLIAATLGAHTSASLPQVELEIKQLLEGLKLHALDPDTLRYGQAQALKKLDELNSLEVQVSVIGNLEAIGQSWTLIDSEPAQLQRITADDIQRVANQYFCPERLSVTHIFAREA